MKMTFTEYDQEIGAINLVRKIALLSLDNKFAKANRSANVGDTITDNLGSIIVEDISVYHSISKQYPEAVYLGVVLNKDGKVGKKFNKREVYESNIKKIIKAKTIRS